MQLIADNLACLRSGRLIFQGVSFRLDDGEGLVLTGPNGSGKTSLMRIVAGFLSATHGEVRLEGLQEDATLQENCHYVGHHNGVKPSFSVAENLRFYASFLGGGDIAEALDYFGLTAIQHIPAGYLSAGQKRRLGLARLMVAPRSLWLLDEPSVSLDKRSTSLLADIMKKHLADGGIMVAATHLPLGVDFAKTLDMSQEGLHQ